MTLTEIEVDRIEPTYLINYDELMRLVSIYIKTSSPISFKNLLECYAQIVKSIKFNFIDREGLNMRKLTEQEVSFIVEKLQHLKGYVEALNDSDLTEINKIEEFIIRSW